MTQEAEKQLLARKAREALPREDWQWLADQLRAWPERRVHPDRTMCEAVLRPMAADVIEGCLAAFARASTIPEGCVVVPAGLEALRWLAEQTTIDERMAVGDAPSEWSEAGPERRIEMMGERKRAHDQAVLNARAALAAAPKDVEG